LSVSLFEKIDLLGALQPDHAPPLPLETKSQFLLFDP